MFDRKKLNINYQKIENFLKFGYKFIHKNNRSFFKNVFKVPSSSYLKVTDNEIKEFKYWDLDSKIVSIDVTSYFRNLTEKLFTSIQLRLRSDFPIAFHLSGGIDSNSLAFIAKKYFNYNLKTYSVVGTDPKYDESKMINFASKNLGAEHTNYKVILKN